MLKKAGWVSAGLSLTALSMLASVSLGAGAAEAAVVYCKTVGVPKGCVVRPTDSVREDTGPRQMFAAEPVRIAMPRIGLFDPE